MEEVVEPEDVVDLYAILGVPKDASSADIKHAYRKLCPLYHPDHQPEEVKEAANERFKEITKAYSVLSNEKQRKIYDECSKDGILPVTTSTELAERSTDFDEIKKHIEQATKEREQKEGSGSLFHGKVELKLSAVKNSEGIAALHVNEIFKYDHDEKNTLFFGPIVSQNRSQASNQVYLSYRRNIQELQFVEVGTYVGVNVMRFRVVAHGNPSPNTLGVLVFDQSNSRGHLVLQYYHKIYETYSWFSETQIGSVNSIKGGLKREKDNRLLEGSLKLANLSYVGENPFSTIKPLTEISYRYPHSKREDVKLSLELPLTPSYPVSFRLGYKHKFHKTFHFAVDSVVTTQGNHWDLMIHYREHKLSIPIILSENPGLTSSLLCLLLPVVGVASFSSFILTPYYVLRSKKKKEEQQKEKEEQIAKGKARAEVDIKLMKHSVKKNRQIEEQKRGVLIVEGMYGVLNNKKKTDDDQPVDPNNQQIADVTVPLQYLVENSHIYLRKGTKTNLLGFYDPAPGEKKQLFVRYLFRDRVFEVTIDEKEELNIPDTNKHRVQNT